ncbi:hypothetical protein ACFQX6_67650 [Streptosporangium lutulentum]
MSSSEDRGVVLVEFGAQPRRSASSASRTSSGGASCSPVRICCRRRVMRS